MVYDTILPIIKNIYVKLGGDSSAVANDTTIGAVLSKMVDIITPGGGGAEVFEVLLTKEDESMICNKSNAEIIDAYESGKIIKIYCSDLDDGSYTGDYSIYYIDEDTSIYVSQSFISVINDIDIKMIDGDQRVSFQTINIQKELDSKLNSHSFVSNSNKYLYVNASGNIAYRSLSSATGTSTSNGMTQKAITDALNDKLNNTFDVSNAGKYLAVGNDGSLSFQDLSEIENAINEIIGGMS